MPGFTEAGWVLWGVVFVATIVVYRLRADHTKADDTRAGRP